MAARTFGNLPVNCLTPSQLQALAAKDVVAEDFVDTSCNRESLNTCGGDAYDTLSQYSIYDPGKGIYTAWGDIPLPWETENDLSDEAWQSARYVGGFGYRAGERVVRIEDEGYVVTVYECVTDTPAPSGAFDPTFWSEICRITSSVPLSPFTYTELLSKYKYYDTSPYITKWGDFTSGWEDDLTDPNSDVWNDAKILKEFYYRAGDVVLYDTACGTETCVYVALTDISTNAVTLEPNSPPSNTYWQRQYCVGNGKPDECVKAVSCSGPNRKLVSLSDGFSDLICVPVESLDGVGPRT
jgi:hypothetical protein